MRRGEGGNGTEDTVTAAKMRRGEGGGIGTDTVAAAKRTPFACSLRVRLMRREKRGATAAVSASPLVLTMVVETSSRQDPGNRWSQVSAAPDPVNSTKNKWRRQ
jgi:hypothetical protein